MIYSKIAGIGSFVPEKVLTNEELCNIVDTSDEWIMSRTGIKERRIAEKGLTTSDIAAAAAKKALDVSGLKPEDIELVLVGTITPDMIFPSTSCIVQNKLGLKNAAAFDISAGCSGFIYSLSVADSFIKSGKYKNVLVIGADLLSRITDYEDRSTCVLFGDGGGAAVLTANTQNNRGILSTHMHSEGGHDDILMLKAGGSLMPASFESVNGREHYIKMKGSELFRYAVNYLKDIAQEAIDFNGLKPEDIDLFVPHQANIRIIEATAKKLKFPMERVFVNVEKYGNTSSGSIPIALDEAYSSGRIKEKDIVLIDAIGAGLTWASSIIRW
ncbi:MAG: beta-ketoacyl-ACP synthase III [Candidatus Acidulodesulfobacterium sp.]